MSTDSEEDATKDRCLGGKDELARGFNVGSSVDE
jgi:hypothetical protein